MRFEKDCRKLASQLKKGVSEMCAHINIRYLPGKPKTKLLTGVTLLIKHEDDTVVDQVMITQNLY